MCSDREASDGDEPSSLPACPRCGDPVLVSVATGPHTGTVGPCGCSVPPGLLADLRED
ncbi:hypothetical protein [Natrinema amylolyticum]|uniref:hypothetical protein n=1 Tax=Natrinema amylolyticum TaxID=2878679 RepID=UPI001CFC3189|nr:hypothetical protein [Natrinema amylolyticum]